MKSGTLTCRESAPAAPTCRTSVADTSRSVRPRLPSSSITPLQRSASSCARSRPAWTRQDRRAAGRRRGSRRSGRPRDSRGRSRTAAAAPARCRTRLVFPRWRPTDRPNIGFHVPVPNWMCSWGSPRRPSSNGFSTVRPRGIETPAARRHRPRAHRLAAHDQRPRVAGAGQGLVAMVDVALGQEDGLAARCPGSGCGSWPADRRRSGSGPGRAPIPYSARTARIRDRDVLDVPGHRRRVVQRPCARCARACPRRPSAVRKLARRRRREEGPADRQVGVRSAGSAGFERRRRRDGQAQRQREPDRRVLTSRPAPCPASPCPRPRCRCACPRA